jgi:hypothetical protein
VIVQRSAHDHPETMRRLTAPHASTLDAMAQLLSAPRPRGIRAVDGMTAEPLVRRDPEAGRHVAATGEHPAAQGDVARDGGHG